MGTMRAQPRPLASAQSPRRRTSRITRRVRAGVVVLTLVALNACTALGGSGRATEPPSAPASDVSRNAPLTDRDPAAVADMVAAAVTSGEVEAALGADAQRDLTAITAGMDGLLPHVGVVDVVKDGDTATVALRVSWPFPSGEWAYDTHLRLDRHDRAWSPVWSPTVVHPDLTADTRLVHQHQPAVRGDVLGAGNTRLMTARPVLRLGLNKPDVPTTQQPKSARALAKVLDLNPGPFAERVAAAGPRAFVEALVVRDEVGKVPRRFHDITGAMVVEDTAVIGPSSGFAQALLGDVGPASPAQATQSDGIVLTGDPIGQSGLQARYDHQLRGRPGSAVRIVARDETAGSSVPASKTAYQVKPIRGVNLATTLSRSRQSRAEKILKGVKPAASIVALDLRSGAILAVANSPGSRGYPTATVGRYAPGSTFKVVTSLALLRAGLTPDSRVDCPRFITVDGRRFKNYNDFPADRVGTMTLQDAVALSCNTALIGQHRKLSGPRIRQAATSLGLAQDYESGFPSFYGSVPDPANMVGLAESTIGQGTVESSPMAMAAAAASVARGTTTVPFLIKNRRPSSTAEPLKPAEANQLRAMMGAVVTEGSGRFLRGVAAGAKTGTAEYGTATPPRTHAWMIAYDDEVAVAVMVADGTSGSRTAGPLIEKMLR